MKAIGLNNQWSIICQTRLLIYSIRFRGNGSERDQTYKKQSEREEKNASVFLNNIIENLIKGQFLKVISLEGLVCFVFCFCFVFFWVLYLSLHFSYFAFSSYLLFNSFFCMFLIWVLLGLQGFPFGSEFSALNLHKIGVLFAIPFWFFIALKVLLYVVIINIWVFLIYPNASPFTFSFEVIKYSHWFFLDFSLLI